jgi:hypothetical protein
MSGRGARVSVPLVVVASVAILLALVVGYVRRAAVDSDQFANRATAALRDDSVRSLVADHVTDELVLKHQSDLLAARPIIQSVVSSVVGSQAFTGVFRAGVRDVHRAVFDRDQQTLTLTVVDIGTIVAAGLEAVRPTVARRLEATQRVELVRRDIGSVSAEAADVADGIRLLAPLLLLLAILACAGAVSLSADRRRTVVQLGIGAAVAGIVLVVGLGVARAAVTDAEEAPDASAAAGAVWDAFLGDLHTGAWILAGSGAVVAAAAASLIRPVDINEPLRRAAVWVTTEPTRPAMKAVRGGALVVVGLIVLLDADAVLRLLFTVVGLYLVYAGVSAVLWLVYEPRSPGAERPAREVRTQSRLRGRTLVAAAVAAALIVGAVSAFVGSGGTSTAAPADGPCNGHADLCGRRLNEVALAATHNSMSVPLPGWFSAVQDRPIADQLREGVRGLLIDTYYADRLDNGRLRTFAGEPMQLRRNAERDGLSPDAVDSALRLRERLGFSGKGDRGMYLCHTFCELGGTALSEALDDLHDFLVANPGEVVVVVNQDYVTPKDFVDAVHDAELDDFAYRGPTSGSWPTLRQMIDRNQRVVFLAENEAGAAPWYHLAYEAITQETPYAFSRPDQLIDASQLEASCRPNRGPDMAPLFLVNHWVTTDPVPLPSHADEVNAYGPFLRRLRECRRLRHHIPNLVAVNFYRRGDLSRVVDALNGVE